MELPRHSAYKMEVGCLMDEAKLCLESRSRFVPMTTRSIESITADLKATCQKLRELLVTHDALIWEIQIRKIEGRDFSHASAARDSLAMFGGMGSISDWVISEINGHKLAGRSKTELNDELIQLTNKLFALLKSIETP